MPTLKLASVLRVIPSQHPHLFKDHGLWVARSIDATGYGYTVRQACNEWNALLTSRHGEESRRPLSFHLGAPQE